MIDIIPTPLTHPLAHSPSQDDQATGLGEFVVLPELKSRVHEQGGDAYIDHRDLISQALMERISLFTDDSMDTTSGMDGAGKQIEDRLESMEEESGDVLSSMDGYLSLDGGSGPPSLGSLTLSSQPSSLSQQTHSLSVGMILSLQDGGGGGRRKRERERERERD